MKAEEMVQSVRIENLRREIAKVGKAAPFARLYKLDPTYISQLLNEHRSFGEKAAREIERKVGLQSGSLDLAAGAVAAAPDNKVYVNKVSGGHLSAGTGEIIYDYDELDSSHSFQRDWMQKKGLNPKRCKLWDVGGDSMDPLYPNGCTVLLNLEQRQPVSGKAFALITEDGMRLKRLFKRADGVWEIHSDNPNKTLYPTEIMALDKVAIYGRVRWSAREDD